jgi:hypothetical protein
MWVEFKQAFREHYVLDRILQMKLEFICFHIFLARTKTKTKNQRSEYGIGIVGYSKTIENDKL